MSSVLEYKGYHTKIEYDAENKILFGKIEGIRDFVNFECEDLSSVEQEFHEAVDDYLAFCDDVGKEPDKEYKGVFNVRISPEMHRKIAMRAFKEGVSLNKIVEKAISNYVNNTLTSVINMTETIGDLKELLMRRNKPAMPTYSSIGMKFNSSNIGYDSYHN